MFALVVIVSVSGGGNIEAGMLSDDWHRWRSGGVIDGIAARGSNGVVNRFDGIHDGCY